MRKSVIVFLSLILSSFGLTPASYADSANPPKIQKVTQITKGPYSPGDMIQFSVEVSGGNPGLRQIQMSSDCFNSVWFADPKDYIQIGAKGDFDPSYINEKLITGRIGGCRSKTYMASVSVVDKTLLSDGLSFRSSDLNFEVKNKFLPAVGEVQPDPDFMKLQAQDDVSWTPYVNEGKEHTRINNIEVSKVSELLTLPGFSKLGQPIEWFVFVQNNNNCQIIRRFPGDIGSLKFMGVGKCKVFSSISFDGIKFNVGGNYRLGDGLGRYNFVIEKKNATTASSSITCVKGKLTKKVVGIKPVCPKGYKKK
jgi:hypothetical protein